MVGTALNPTTNRTFWGEMAYQLGGDTLYRRVAKTDEQRISPGTDMLGDLLQAAGPCLIMLDEILVYLIKAGGVNERLKGERKARVEGGISTGGGVRLMG